MHQNGAPKGPELRTAKQLPKGAVLVLLIFLSAYIYIMDSEMIWDILKFPWPYLERLSLTQTG